MAGKYCIDANCFIDYWRSFPDSVVPNFWKNLSQIGGHFILLKEIEDEIKNPEIIKHLKSGNFQRVKINNPVQNKALALGG